MKTELISNKNSKAVFTVEINNEDFKKAIDEVYKRNKGQFNIQGFRKGKAPRKIIEANYGKEIFYEDALNDCLNDVYKDALDEHGLEPIDYPEVDLKDELSTEKPFTAEFTVQLMPEPELKEGYKDAKIDLLQVELKDEDVDTFLENEREKNARLVEVEDRPAEDGDTVNIDYEGFTDGEAFEGGKAEGYDLVLGSHTFIPGFEEGLVGAEKGQELDVEVTFPENYHEELKGKEAVFKVKVNSIKTKELPELDDDFAMDVSEFDTLEEFKKDVKERLEENVARNNKNESYNKAIEALSEYLEVEIPEVLIDNQIDMEMQNFEQRIMQMGMDLDTYYAMTQSDKEEVRNQMRPQAIARIEADFVIDALAEAEGIEASEEEIDKEIRTMAEQSQAEDVDEYIENYKEEVGTGAVERFVIQQKALDKAAELVNFNVVDEYKDGGVEKLDQEENEEVEEEEKEDK